MKCASLRRPHGGQDEQAGSEQHGAKQHGGGAEEHKLDHRKTEGLQEIWTESWEVFFLAQLGSLGQGCMMTTPPSQYTHTPPPLSYWEIFNMHLIVLCFL